jgi:hypothetical protein
MALIVLFWGRPWGRRGGPRCARKWLVNLDARAFASLESKLSNARRINPKDILVADISPKEIFLGKRWKFVKECLEKSFFVDFGSNPFSRSFWYAVRFWADISEFWSFASKSKCKPVLNFPNFSKIWFLDPSESSGTPEISKGYRSGPKAIFVLWE